MSRRDTIIIAVLVNAGLLLVLFATAMRSNKKEEKQATEIVEAANSKETLTPLPADSLALTENSILDAPIGGAPSQGNSPDLFDGALATTEEIEIPIASNAPAMAIPTQEALPPVVLTPPAPKEEPTIALSVTVKKGDVLEKIAKNHGTTVSAIMKANNLASTNLKIGQVLKMPPGSTKKGESASKTSTAGAEYYTVKEGDNPWLIASRNNVKLDELLKLNGMDAQKAKKLRPGDRLRIR